MSRACTTSQYFTIGTASAVQITGDMTLLMWIKGTGTPGSVELIGFYNSGGTNEGYGLQLGEDSARMYYWNSIIGAWQGPSTLAVNDGNWHACGFTITGTGAGAGVFWRDGATNGSWTHSAPVAFTGTKSIGARSNGGLIAGFTLAEIAIWNVALSAAEHAAYARGMLPRKIRPSNLVAYWPMWGLHDPEPDFGINHYSATLVAGPTLANHPPISLSSAQWWAHTAEAEAILYQYARPSADAHISGWTDDAGGTTNLYATLNEAVFDDNTFIQTGETPNGAIYAGGPLVWDEPFTDPQVTAGFVVEWRYGKHLAAGEALDLTVELRHSYVSEGSPGTLIATIASLTGIAAFPIAGSYELTEAEAAVVVTNNADLSLRLIANTP